MAHVARYVFRFAGAAIVLLSLSNTAWANAQDCFPSRMGRTPSDPADLPLWRKAMEVAGVDPKTCGIAVRPWPHETDAYVLYAESPVEYNVVDHQLVLLRKKADSFEVVARHRTAGNPYVFESFDFARYAIRKGAIAIGVRLQESGPTIGGGYECTRLVLFERVQSELKPVLSAMADQSAEGNEVAYDSDTRFETSATSTFIMGKADGSGYKRIVRKHGKAKVVFAWDGSGYAQQGDGDANCLAERCYCQGDYQ
jgi:hypothetical protein